MARNFRHIVDSTSSLMTSKLKSVRKAGTVIMPGVYIVLACPAYHLLLLDHGTANV
jgi:hypothetical protein